MSDRQDDPTDMTPHDLTVPDMTPDEEVQAAKYRALQTVREVLNARIDDPDHAIDQVRAILGAVV